MSFYVLRLEAAKQYYSISRKVHHAGLHIASSRKSDVKDQKGLLCRERQEYTYPS